MAKILTKTQTIVLKAISKTGLVEQFYFSGGTALAHYYLQHRYSEDLDFFSKEEFNPLEVTAFIKTIKDKVGFVSFDYQNSFNRNLYFLKCQNKNEVLKLEFTYYPFKQIETPSLRDGLKVDSVLDIAVNKLFTIAQKPRGRDYFDLYMIIKKYNFEIERLRMLAKQKFDWDVDKLLLGSRFYEVNRYKDDPILINKAFDLSQVESFFKKRARELEKELII